MARGDTRIYYVYYDDYEAISHGQMGRLYYCGMDSGLAVRLARKILSTEEGYSTRLMWCDVEIGEIPEPGDAFDFFKTHKNMMGSFDLGMGHSSGRKGIPLVLSRDAAPGQYRQHAIVAELPESGFDGEFDELVWYREIAGVESVRIDGTSYLLLQLKLGAVILVRGIRLEHLELVVADIQDRIKP